MNDDLINLPERKPHDKIIIPLDPETTKFRPVGTTMRMDLSPEVVQEIGKIASSIMDIVKIRENNRAEVALINAKTDAVVKMMQKEIEHISENRKKTEARGEIAVRLLKSVTEMLQHIPESDNKSRSEAILITSELMKMACSDGK